MIQFQENARTDEKGRWKDVQTLFRRALPTISGGPINLDGDETHIIIYWSEWKVILKHLNFYTGRQKITVST